MRVLVIGFPLPNQQIDNYNLLTAPSWFDYDAVVVEPLSISQVIEDVLQAREQHETRANEPVLNRPTNPFAVALAEVVRRRRSETAQLLANGGVVVVFGQPNVIHEGVVGFPGCDRYAWLPAPAGVAYEPPFLLRAEGTEVQPVDSTHPFAPLLDEYSTRFGYRARIDESVPGFPTYGHVFARSTGGAAVGVELRSGKGRIIFLPAFSGVAFGDQRYQLAGSMLTAIRRALHRGADVEPPPWVSGASLPGLEHLQAGMEQAEQELEAAEQALEDAQAAFLEIAQYRALLWQEGSLVLEPVVREAFRLLGFAVEGDAEKPGWIDDNGQRCFYEVESSDGVVTEYPYFRLQKRLERDLIDTRLPKRGLIVVNGYNRQEPSARPTQYSETLRIAAENYRYGLLTTERLFELVRAMLERPDDAAMKAQIRTLLLDAVGNVPATIVPANSAAGAGQAPVEVVQAAGPAEPGEAAEPAASPEQL